MAIHLGGGDSLSGASSSTVSEINITPFVDVVLVLLIIFMVTAPQLQQGFDIDVPTAAAKTVEITDDQVVVTVDKERKVWLDKFEVPPGMLAAELAKVFSVRADKRLYIRGDKDIPYGAVIDVLAAAREAGVTQIGMITAAPQPAAGPGSALAEGAPQGRAPQEAAPQQSAPQQSAPQGGALEKDAPQGRAPEQGAPEGRAPSAETAPASATPASPTPASSAPSAEPAANPDPASRLPLED